MPAIATHERFDALAGRFADTWRAVEPLVEPAFVRDDWAERNAQLAAAAPAGDWIPGQHYFLR